MRLLKSLMSDGEIIELYFRRDERAISETDAKYGKYLFSVAYNVVHDRLDCEECLNDTYLDAWNAMPPERPAVLKAFLAIIMRRRAIDRYKSEKRKRRIPSELTVSLSELEFTLSDDTPQSELDAIHRRAGTFIDSEVLFFLYLIITDGEFGRNGTRCTRTGTVRSHHHDFAQS